MLTNTANTAAKVAKSVVRNHPNTVEIQLFRKVISEQKKTLGGARVLGSSDEHDYSFEYVESGYAIPANQFQISPMFESQNAAFQEEGDLRYLLAPEGDTWTSEPKKNDIMLMVFGDVRIAFELISPMAPINMSPFPVIWSVNRNQEVDISGLEES